MKRIFTVLVLMLTVLLLLAACGKEDTTASSTGMIDQAPTPSPPGVTQSVSLPAVTSSPSSASEDSSVASGSLSATSASESTVSSVPGGGSFSGIIDGAGMGKFAILLDDGFMLEVEYSGADLSALQDTRPGSEVVVYYEGILNGNDTSGITVTRIETPAA